MRHGGTMGSAGPGARQVVGAWPRGLIVVILLPLVAVAWSVVRPPEPVLRAIDAMHIWAAGPVYTVADVEHVLVQAPRAWSGRTVLVQGRVAVDRTWSPPDSIVTRLALVDPGRADGLRPLYLQWGRPDPWLAVLRRLPLLGRLVPPPQRPRVGLPGIYRVRLAGPSASPPGGADLVLLDANPNYR